MAFSTGFAADLKVFSLRLRSMLLRSQLGVGAVESAFYLCSPAANDC
jgi:hypothetical protein